MENVFVRTPMFRIPIPVKTTGTQTRADNRHGSPEKINWTRDKLGPINKQKAWEALRLRNF